MRRDARYRSVMTVTVDVFPGGMPPEEYGGNAAEGDVQSGGQRLSAGFPSPAENFAKMPIDLNRVLVRHPSATFFGRVKGDAMDASGIGDGDLLIIDRSVEPSDGRVAVCHIDGEFSLRRIQVDGRGVHLVSPGGKRVTIGGDTMDDWRLWGVVTHVVKRL